MPQPRGGAPLADDAHPDGAPAGTMLTWQQLLAAYRDDFVEASRKQRMAQGREETRLGRAEEERSGREGEEGVNGRGSSTFTSDQQEHLRPEITQSVLTAEAGDGRGRVVDRRGGLGDERRNLARSLVTEVQAHPLLRHTGQPSHPDMLSVPPMPPGVASMPPGTAFMLPEPEVMSSRCEFPPTPTTPHMPPSPHSPLPHSPLPQLASLSEDFSLSHSSSAAPLSSASQPSQELDSLADLLIRMSLSTGSRHSMGGAGLKGIERHGMGPGGSRGGERHSVAGGGLKGVDPHSKGVSFEQEGERHSIGGGSVKGRAVGEESMVGGAERMGQEGSMGGKGTMGFAGGMRGEGSMGGAEGMGEERQSMGNWGVDVSAIGGEGTEGMGGDWEGMGSGDAMGGKWEGKGMGSEDVGVVREVRDAGGEWRAGAVPSRPPIAPPPPPPPPSGRPPPPPPPIRLASGKLAAPGMGGQQGEGEGERADGEGDLFPPARPLHWSKVTNVKGTVWEEIEREGAGKKEREETVGDGESQGSSSSVLVSKVTLPDDMRRAIRVLFQVKATKPGGKSKARGVQGEGGGSGGRKGLGKDELQVVGLARANNVAIMLTQFRMPENRIRDLILAGDPKHVLPPDRLGLLLQVIPTEEEAAKFRAVSGAASGAMCAPERFLWSISLIPRMRRKIEALMFVRHFHTIVNDARAVIKVFCSAARAIRSSKVLRAALAAALEVGNELNRGSARGSARGFSLDSLARLSEVRVTPPSHRAKGLDTLTPAASPFPSHQSHPSNPPPLIARATTLLDVVVIITRGGDSTRPNEGEEEAGEVGRSLMGSSVRNKGGDKGAQRRGKLTVELGAVGEAVRMSQADVADATSALDTGLRLVDEEVRLLQQETEEARLQEGEEAEKQQVEEREERQEDGQGGGLDSEGGAERQRKGKGVRQGGLLAVLAEFRLNARKEREELANDAEECSADEENSGEFTAIYPSDLRIANPKEVTSTADEVEKLRKDEKDRQRRRRTCCCRVACWSLIVLAVLIVGLGVAGLVAYLTVSKQQPEVKVERINILRVGITKSGGGFLGLENFRLGLSALINVTALVYNPNNWDVEAENISIDVKFFDMSVTNVTIPGVLGMSKGGSAELTVPLDIVDAPLATLSPASLLTTPLLHGRAEMRVVVGTAARVKYWGISSPRVMVHVECTMQLDPFSAKKYNEQCTPSISL
ncbi:unnamed protein product [Closterium sp. NIES-64]|nr:unnamed protein product [Closterium sp. NIES-64]